MVDQSNLAARVQSLKWYHRIDLGNGIVTPGQHWKYVDCVRRLVEPLDLSGRRCLDIGAADGGITHLLESKSANTVATDFVPFDTFKLVSEICNFKGQYLTGDKFEDLLPRLRKNNSLPFDFIYFGGLLYSLLDPTRALLSIRAMMREGSLVLVESACADSNDLSLHFNAEGLYLKNAYCWWFPSPAALRYLMLFCGLLPIREEICKEEHGGAATHHAILARAIDVKKELSDDFPWIVEAHTRNLEKIAAVIPELLFPKYDDAYNPIPREATISKADLRKQVDRCNDQVLNSLHDHAANLPQRVLRKAKAAFSRFKPGSGK